MQITNPEWYALKHDLSGVALEKGGEKPWYLVEKKAYSSTKSLFSDDRQVHYQYKPTQQRGRNALGRKGWELVRVIETEQWYSELNFCFYDPSKTAKWLSFKEVQSWASFEKVEQTPLPVYYIALAIDFLRVVSQLDNWQQYDEVTPAQKDNFKASAEPLQAILLSNISSYAYSSADYTRTDEIEDLKRLLQGTVSKLNDLLKGPPSRP